jgi:hypothetical protein
MSILEEIGVQLEETLEEGEIQDCEAEIRDILSNQPKDRAFKATTVEDMWQTIARVVAQANELESKMSYMERNIETIVQRRVSCLLDKQYWRQKYNTFMWEFHCQCNNPSCMRAVHTSFHLGLEQFKNYHHHNLRPGEFEPRRIRHGDPLPNRTENLIHHWCRPGRRDRLVNFMFST